MCRLLSDAHSSSDCTNPSGRRSNEFKIEWMRKEVAADEFRSLLMVSLRNATKNSIQFSRWCGYVSNQTPQHRNVTTWDDSFNNSSGERH